MHVSNAETKEEYTIEDLPKFFKNRSKKISKKFSDGVIEISTIRSESTKDETQEISFKLKLQQEINSNQQEVHARIFYKIIR